MPRPVSHTIPNNKSEMSHVSNVKNKPITFLKTQEDIFMILGWEKIYQLEH